MGITGRREGVSCCSNATAVYNVQQQQLSRDAGRETAAAEACRININMAEPSRAAPALTVCVCKIG